MYDDDWDSLRDKAVNDPLWAADEIERLRGELARTRAHLADLHERLNAA